MKKFFAILLVLALAATALPGCFDVSCSSDSNAAGGAATSGPYNGAAASEG